MVEGYKKFLYVVVCGSGLAPSIYHFVPIAQQAQWDACVILTPMSKRFLDSTLLETMTGHPVRSEYKQNIDDLDVLPRADAIVVYPATFNIRSLARRRVQVNTIPV